MRNLGYFRCVGPAGRIKIHQCNEDTPVNLKSLAMGAGLFLASASASALNIVLTNDDGWSTPGIQVVFDALTEAGHTVVLAAPLDGQSGSAAGFNLGGLEITKQADNQYSVAVEGGETGAEPATSGAVGTQIMQGLTGAAPDLLVSGINDSANLAAATVTSGPVGAAIHAIATVLGESIPAIAISTDERCNEEDGKSPECREVADFLVDYIDHLEQRKNYLKGNSGLIPNGKALNINFPPVEPKGVKVAKQGNQPLLGGSVRYLELGCKEDCNDLEIGETAEGGILGAPAIEGFEDIPNSDADLFAEGYITVVVIEASYGANARGLKGYLNTFKY